MKKKKLTYWDSNPNDGRTLAFTRAGEAFCAEEDGLEFEYIPRGIDNYVEDVLAAWKAGEGPDVVDVWPHWVPRLAGPSGLLQLDPWVGAWERKADYDPSHQRLSVSYDGSHRFLACDLFVQGTHYRRDLVERAGLADPRKLDSAGEWSMDAFARHARALHRPAEGVFGVSLRGGQGSELTVFNVIASATGRPVFDRDGSPCFDDPAGIAALEDYISLARPPVACQPAPEDEGYRQFAWHFYEGRAATMLHNDDGVKAAQERFLGRERYAAARFPSAGGQPRIALAGFGVGVHSKSPLQDVAAHYVLQFIEGYGRRLGESAEALSPGGDPGISCTPMRPWTERRDPKVEPFRQALESTETFFDLPYDRPAFDKAVRAVIRPDIRRLLRGETTPSAACARWQCLSL
ncbi:MAG: extracellular solute-binding protein [Opitutales bacterium]|nr:extracellular solute-binding protein [Opitutales bacterium]